MDWLKEKLGIETKRDWYFVSHAEIKALHGNTSQIQLK
jgi:hypothetical protein